MHTYIQTDTDTPPTVFDVENELSRTPPMVRNSFAAVLNPTKNKKKTKKKQKKVTNTHYPMARNSFCGCFKTRQKKTKKKLSRRVIENAVTSPQFLKKDTYESLKSYAPPPPHSNLSPMHKPQTPVTPTLIPTPYSLIPKP